MTPTARVQWLHKKIADGSYPNAHRLAERFRISPRQAQRDLDFLRKRLNAPVAYDSSRRGFYYTEPFVLPLVISSDNDDLYLPEIASVRDSGELAAEESLIQMQIPYTATLEIPDRLAAMEMNPYITERHGKNRFTCEFHSAEKFIGALLMLNADFQIIEPEWLRERMVNCARIILKNHPQSE